MSRAIKQYEAYGYAGCVVISTSRKTRTKVGLYQSDQAGIESDPRYPWTTVCEEHKSCVCHESMRAARYAMADPSDWCDECREAHA